MLGVEWNFIRDLPMTLPARRSENQRRCRRGLQLHNQTSYPVGIPFQEKFFGNEQHRREVWMGGKQTTINNPHYVRRSGSINSVFVGINLND
jgi:hypothetical protein